MIDLHTHSNFSDGSDSPAQLAANAEVPIAQLARFEAGSERLGAAVFLRISRVLGVRPAYLFDIEGRTSPQA